MALSKRYKPDLDLFVLLNMYLYIFVIMFQGLVGRQNVYRLYEYPQPPCFDV